MAFHSPAYSYSLSEERKLTDRVGRRLEKRIMIQQELPFEIRDMRHKEKFEIDDIYLNGYARKCGIYATGVYVSLCRHINKEQQCWPSIRKIAEELDISEKQVSRSLKILEKNKLILKKRIGKKLNNRYVLLDRSEWTGSPITTDPQSDHIGTDSPIHSKESQLRTTHNTRLAKPTIRKEIKFNNNDYKKVITKYEELKGVKFQGREYEPIQQDIKTMFLSGRKPEEIIHCLEFMARDEFYKTIFTMKTIKLKIAEFLAGKLERPKKPYYNNNIMREMYGKWKVLIDGIAFVVFRLGSRRHH